MKVRICPQCGSTNVTSRGAISREAVSPNLFCKSCGFQGVLFPEAPIENLKKLKAEDKGNNFSPSQSALFIKSPTVAQISKHRKRIAIFGGVILILVLLLLL